MQFKRVEAKTSLRRSFAITLGLSEGYGESAKVHTRQEVVDAALAYMKAKAAAGEPFLTGTVSAEGTVVYAWPESPGKSGGGKENTIVFYGEVSVLYNADTSDEDVKAMLDDMATSLGSILGQTRVYVAYRDQTWVLQAEQTATPTGEKVA